MEQTFIIIKPDAIQRGIIGDVITRFEKIGLKIIGMKMFKPSKDLLNKHYPIEREEFMKELLSDFCRECFTDTRESRCHCWNDE